MAVIGTSYDGVMLFIEPQQSAGDQDVVITGQAMERATGLPLANVPLNLVISVGLRPQEARKASEEILGLQGIAI